MRKLPAAGLVVLCALLLHPAAAAAAAVAVEGPEIVVRGGAESSRLSVSEGRGIEDGRLVYHFHDPDNALVPGQGCEAFDGEHGARCALPQGRAPARIRADMGPGTDLARHDPGSPTPVDFFGGEGTDYLIGGAGADRLDGGPGPDALAGDEGLGTPGAGRFQPDELIGGDGRDRVIYAEHGAPRIVVTIDDRPDDGAPGEGDNVRGDVEDLQGDFAAENVLIGSAEANLLRGGNRADTLDGRGGSDQLDGGHGNDALEARDGAADLVDCGGDADRATVDGADRVEPGCEQVDAPPRPTPEQLPPPPPPAVVEPLHGTFPVAFARTSVRPDRRRRVSFVLRCAASAGPEGCRGMLLTTSLRPVRIGRTRRPFSLGSRTFAVAAGSSTRVTFTLSRAHAAALRRVGRVRLIVSAVETGTRRRALQVEVVLRRR